MKTKLYLLTAAIIVAFLFGFMFQETERFYYGFNEKIPLTEVENKLVVRYSESVNKDNTSSALTRTYATVHQTWKDNRTVVLSTGSKADRNVLMENLQSAPEVSSCQPMYTMNTGLEMIVTDEIVMKFKAHIRTEQQQEINQKFGVTQVKDGETYLLLRVPKGSDALTIANQYQESGYVDFSHPNFIVKFDMHQQVIPNDTYFGNQFTVHNTGQVFNDGHFGTPDADIDAPEAWAMTTGVNNILVAVLDQGVSPNHPDLPNARQVRLNGSNFADGNPNDPSPTGNTNHGNACAGVIAATQNNNEGIAGICPNCRIMPIRIFDSFENAIPETRLADAINFARNNLADIISNSWGAAVANPNFSPLIVTAIQTATTQGRVINGVARGCVVLFSAGNNPTNNGIVHFPANVNIPGVLAVGASDRDDLKSFYSPLGNPASPNNQLLDVTAPSHRAYPFQVAGETLEAWTIDVPNNAGYNPWPQFTSLGNASIVPPAIGEQLPNVGINFQSYTGRFGGTSHSCPVVAGIAALMLSANPNLTQQQVFNIITNTANQVGGYVYTNGRSNELGFGRANACQALREAYRIGNSVNGPAILCSNATYSLQNSPNADRISWSTSNPNGLAINATTGAATRQNNFNGQVTITATIESACRNVNITRNVNVGNSPPLGLSSVNSNCSGNSFNVLNTSLSGICSANTAVYFTYNITDPNYSNFVFTPVSVPSGASWSGGGGNLYVTVYTPSSSGSRSATIALSATGPCGTYNVNFNSSAVNISSGWRFSMSPNPTDGQVTVSTDSESLLEKDSPNLIYAIKVIDPSGTRSESFEFNGGINSTAISLKDRQPGLYILSVFDGKTWSSKQLLIQK